ncbi:hypothetical protein [Methanococcoides sp. NM1]|uniref:hypothetical protein n=1 Tax=Methanococcoides sp. NM1 TaxID=1201013 RepID=UPI00108468EC|nr:hypothetical protein [Methanococcoides sp. NM1]
MNNGSVEMDLSNKNKDKPTLAELKRAEVEKKAFELGFEVGYHKHSEIGWVKENFVKLESLANSLGLGDIVSDKYIQGKGEGGIAREKGLNIGSVTSAMKKEGEYSLSEELAFKKPKEEAPEGYKDYAGNDAIFAPVGRPKFLENPSCTSLAKAVERPANLDGFKPLMPKK